MGHSILLILIIQISALNFVHSKGPLDYAKSLEKANFTNHNDICGKDFPTNTVCLITEHCSYQKYDLVTEKYKTGVELYDGDACTAIIIIKKYAHNQWRVMIDAYAKTVEPDQRDPRIIFIHNNISMLECTADRDKKIAKANLKGYYRSLMTVQFSGNRRFQISDIQGQYDETINRLMCEFTLDFGREFKSDHDTFTGLIWQGPNVNQKKGQNTARTIQSLNFLSADVELLVNGKCEMSYLHPYNHTEQTALEGLHFTELNFNNYPLECHTMYAKIRDEENGFKRISRIECEGSDFKLVGNSTDTINNKHIVVKCMEPDTINFYCRSEMNYKTPADINSHDDLWHLSYCWTCPGDHQKCGKQDRVGRLMTSIESAASSCGYSKNNYPPNCFMQMCRNGVANNHNSSFLEFKSATENKCENFMGYVARHDKCCKQAYLLNTQCVWEGYNKACNRFLGFTHHFSGMNSTAYQSGVACQEKILGPDGDWAVYTRERGIRAFLNDQKSCDDDRFSRSYWAGQTDFYIWA